MIDVLLKRPGSTWHKRNIAGNLYEFQMLVEGKVRNKLASQFGENCYFAFNAAEQDDGVPNIVDTDKQIIYGNIVVFCVNPETRKYDDWPLTEAETDEITGLWGIVKTR